MPFLLFANSENPMGAVHFDGIDNRNVEKNPAWWYRAPCQCGERF